MFGCLGDFGIAERALPHRVFGTRAIFLLLLTLRKLLIMQHFLLLFLLSPVCTIFFVHRKIIRVGQYRQLGVLTYHVTSAGPGTWLFLHQHTSVTSASPADQLRHIS